MAEVHLFGDYLNLYGHSIAARGERRAREREGGGDDTRGKEKWKEENKRGQRRGKDNRRQEDKKRKRVEQKKSPSQVRKEGEGRRMERGSPGQNLTRLKESLTFFRCA